MARRRGFFAEMQHQAKLAEQRQRAAAREQEKAARRTELARKTEERKRLAAQRASEAERKRLEKEAAAAHLAMRQAEVEELNSQLTATYDRVDSLLEATLEVDDYVDLEKLRQKAVHPPFAHDNLKRPLAAPHPIPDPPAPVFQPPVPPTGLFKRKQKLAAAQAQAEAEYAQAMAAWEDAMQRLPARRQKRAAQHDAAEATRKRALGTQLARYEDECAAREKEAAEQNAILDQFITDLGYGSVEAVQEYVGIVLANSVYPEGFTVEHEATYDPSTAELSLRVLIPGPDTIPRIKNYRYVKASDEITTVSLSQKDSKDRYLGVVQQVALRSLHEVFEADRRSLIQSIALEVGTEAVDPATGKKGYVPFLAVGTSRETFVEIDLSAVVPAATLDYLGASVSKNPLGLVPANTEGVRRS